MKLKKWVRVLLATISILAFIFMGSDCESTLMFFISHIIACGIFALSTTTLIKFSDLGGE